MYVEVMEHDKIKLVKESMPNESDPVAIDCFIRSHERIQFCKYVLQYMISFVFDLPLGDKAENDLVNPFDQMKDFSRFFVELLREPDVIDSIMKEQQEKGVLNDMNIWYFRGIIKKVFDDLIIEVESAVEPTVDSYLKLFKVLNNLSLYWFTVRNLDAQRIRTTDIYLYKLSKALMERHSSQPRNH